MKELPPDFKAERLRWRPARLIFEACAELAKQGTPRRWFSSLALVREFERVGAAWGQPRIAAELQVFTFCRMARATARAAA
jgi:hypothetical protein